MKKLRLNKIFHWLYAFLMLYPLIGLIFLSLVCAFNGSVDFSNPDGINPGFLSDTFNQFCGNLIIGHGAFDSSFILGIVDDNICNFVNSLGFDLSDFTNVNAVIGGLFVHWIEVSLFYLLFDVLMYPINLFHRWIDEGGI